ncbi:hypothetical protein [Macrococcus animalis]|uniref:hypothetical protein n=1 Tax=Macrococcus animalis TaxID=3395467 RepID=UPI0039BE353B
MNNTLPLLDIRANTSLVYKVSRFENHPKYVCFEIAFIVENQNIQFTHTIFEDELPVLNRLLLLEIGEYHFFEPDIYFEVKQVHETTIDINLYLDIDLINGIPSNDKYKSYDMVVDKKSFIQLIEFLMYHLKN